MAETRSVDIAWFGLRPAPRKRLVTVSADHLADERSGVFYTLDRVELLSEFGRTAAADTLFTDMQVEVMIMTGRNKLMSYVFEPLAQTIRHTFRET